MKLNLLWLVLAIAPTYLFAQTTVVIDPVMGTTITVYDNNPLQDLRDDANAIEVHTGDDGSASVPLPFIFPYFGESFDSSWMYTNGAISFTGTSGGFCCDGANLVALNQAENGTFNYSILPLWADLYSYDNQTYYMGTESSMTYGWYGVTEYGAWSNSNSFEVTLNENGNISFSYGNADVSSHFVTVGLIGDITQDEFIQFYNGYGYTDTSQFEIVGGEPQDPCATNPLYSTQCSGYEQAYLQQQCTSNPLYSTQCVGYAEAYYNQQCSLNPLYDSNCTGYTEAYYNYQCSINPLYDEGCVGYSQAYFLNQCTINPLYDRTCEGFEREYVLTTITEESVQSPIEELLTVTDTTIIDMTVDSPIITQEQVLEEDIADSSTESIEAEAVVSEVVGTAKDKKEAIDTKVSQLKKELEDAKTLKDQVRLQAQIAALIAYVPSFDTYAITIPDAPFYVAEEIYQDVQISDSANGLRMGLASEVRYDEMLEQQYNRR